ncbi:MAG: hypothetical protein J0I98_11375 [Mesorhizobium sp.]|mgnify:CR=1 FL=1|nr:hypothetical protein [Mesorhizobium sp.]MBN9243384.1 hypothetical protein [Mesorhizobium sp.]
MAKKTQGTGDTRQKLIDDAKAKFAAAEEALDAAQQEFAAADNSDGKAAAQVKINAATAERDRLAAVIDALLKDPGASGADDEDGPTTRDFIVGGNGVIRHNGRDYAEGDTIALTKPEWEQLAPLKVLAGEA